MAHSFVLQDWLLLESTVGTAITQPENGWLDLSDYQDVTFYLLVNQASATTTISYQTSPDKTDSVFTNMVPAITMAASASPTVTEVLMLSAAVPLARFVRWQITGPNQWSANFRIVVAANAPGL